jgi:hypothetical protein
MGHFTCGITPSMGKWSAPAANEVARATAEAARVAREAEAYKAGHQHGRQDVISIMPLLVAAQHPPPEARASGDER